MKKVVSVAIAMAVMLMLVVSSFAMPVFATEDMASIGVPGDSIWKEFDTSELNQVAKLIRQEFNRTSALRSEMHKGEQYFNYGEPTGEKVHAWVGGAGEYPDGTVHDTIGCMNQDFSGGSSTCLQAFEQPAQWCCIVVTRAGFEKGEAYTIRDTVASMYAQAGGPNSSWGLPVGNQYWVVEDGQEILYQQFENGYARSIGGSSLSALCHFYHDWDEDYNSGFPKSGEEDRPSFANVAIKGNSGPSISDVNTQVEIPDSIETWVEPPAEDDPATDDPATEDPATDDPATDDPAEETESTESTDATESTDSAASDASTIEVEDDLAEGDGTTAGTTSTTTIVVRKASPFLQFLMDYWWILVIAAVVVIGAVVAIIIVAKNKKKAAAPADAAKNEADKK